MSEHTETLGCRWPQPAERRAAVDANADRARGEVSHRDGLAAGGADRHHGRRHCLFALQPDRAVHQHLLLSPDFLRVSSAPATIISGLWVIVTPVIGGIIVGIMARYGSDKIRGHGIPEAMEAVLINRSRIEPKVAILKPISAAIAIGTGGPFGAEGPDHSDRRRGWIAGRPIDAHHCRRTQSTAGLRRGGRHGRDVQHSDRRASS